MMVWGSISLDSHTDLHMLANGTLTAVKNVMKSSEPLAELVAI